MQAGAAWQVWMRFWWAILTSTLITHPGCGHGHGVHTCFNLHQMQCTCSQIPGYFVGFDRVLGSSHTLCGLASFLVLAVLKQLRIAAMPGRAQCMPGGWAESPETVYYILLNALPKSCGQMASSRGCCNHYGMSWWDRCPTVLLLTSRVTDPLERRVVHSVTVGCKVHL